MSLTPSNVPLASLGLLVVCSLFASVQEAVVLDPRSFPLLSGLHDLIDELLVSLDVTLLTGGGVDLCLQDCVLKLDGGAVDLRVRGARAEAALDVCGDAQVRLRLAIFILCSFLNMLRIILPAPNSLILIKGEATGIQGALIELAGVVGGTVVASAVLAVVPLARGLLPGVEIRLQALVVLQ